MRARKTDINQSRIVDALRKCGYSVAVTSSIGNGFPDLVAGKGGINFLIEVKQPGKEKGLTTHQIEFIARWRGNVIVASEVGAVLTFMAETERKYFNYKLGA